ncbi:MAG: ABC transporter permease, partial [Bdellovibrionales bacterium]|nr:ABC transporter permease [Bdellovibrionales bacterium]
SVFIDGAGLQEIDSAGAMHLVKTLSLSGGSINQARLINFSSEQEALIRLVAERLEDATDLPKAKKFSVLARVGRSGVSAIAAVLGILNFLGFAAIGFFELLKSPQKFRYRETVAQLEAACVSAIGIVALVTFLIGIVVAYLYASQMEKYGANIFIVEAVSIAMCRELSPIIVAIIVAGRSGSSFTAQIGTMKLNEEIDAIQTLGLSSLQVLVIPRVIALMIAMPLLVFVGNVAGIGGGMAIAEMYADINLATFLERMQDKLALKHLVIGLMKAPIFAAFIAVIGCKMGLTAENNARSVGLNTTATVVQSIVSVILLDAFFAIITVELGY